MPSIIQWVKKFFIRLMLRFTARKPILETIFEVDSEDPHRTGVLPHPVEEQLEYPTNFKTTQNVSDGVKFVGFRASTGEMLVASINRNSDGTAEVWLIVRLKDGRMFTLPRQQVEVDLSEENVFSCAGLKLICLYPMVRWRIVYNGALAEISSTGEPIENTVHAYLGFFVVIQNSSADYTTFHNHDFLAKQLSNKNGFPNFSIQKQLDKIQIHTQNVYFAGKVIVDGEDKEVFLWGHKVSCRGDETSLLEHHGQLNTVSENGIQMDLHETSLPGFCENLQFGCIMLPMPQERPVSDISNSIVDSNGSSISSFSVQVEKLTIYTKLNQRLLTVKQLKRQYNTVHPVTIEVRQGTIDGINAIALFVSPIKKEEIITERPKIPRCLRLLQENEGKTTKSAMVVSFEDLNCLSQSVSGGKGSSLGMLLQLAKTVMTSCKFFVPTGVVVTTTAYETFIRQEKAANAIEKLKHELRNDNLEDLKKMCETCVSSLSEVMLPDQVKNELKTKLLQMCNASGNGLESAKFAVRSSACGEDSEEMSAAGQMQTFLGVLGFDEICAAVAKCWASQFGFVAVQYKRRYGQDINVPMAVVVQQMIESDVSGVMFSRDPLNGNPKIISITANYGLGESVVSASADPDSVKVRRNFTDESLSIENIYIGEKRTKIVCNENGNVKEEEIDSERKNKLCLSHDQCFHLARVGILLEEDYASPRDIEWAFKNDELYLLQSRPVTSFEAETEFEIKHERNHGIFSEWETLSKANIGEVIGGCISTLSDDLCFRAGMKNRHIQKASRAMKVHRCHNIRLEPPFFRVFGSHFFLTTYNNFQDSTATDLLSKGMAFSMAGRLDTSDLSKRNNDNKRKYRLPQRSFNFFQNPIKAMITARSDLENEEKVGQRYIPVEKYSKSADMLHEITTFRTDSPAGLVHGKCIMYSSVANVLNMGLLAYAEGDFNERVLSDFSKLTQNCNNVLSAEIPQTLQQLGRLIASECDVEVFKTWTPEQALDWIQNESKQASKLFKEFLERHGHRCLYEFDIGVKTWSMEPTTVVKTLQSIVGNVAPLNQTEADFDKIIDSLEIKLGRVQKFLLKHVLLSWCRAGIAYRERAKSNFIRSTNTFRIALRHLGQQMVKEGLISDVELVFDLLVHELEDVILRKKLAPKHLAKALLRQRMRQKEKSVIYPEISAGVAVPINTSSKVEFVGGSKMMQGTPVSQGTIVGRACVITKLEDAVQIQKGDILITYATDIGWSPYFPLLSGIATELGGLISHGAVVAREYGLPCVVALHGVTTMFSTGDTVFLDGNRGVVQTVDKTTSTTADDDCN